MSATVRALAPTEHHWITLVARGMASTLDEVIGPGRDHHQYTADWLEDRVRHHLDSMRCEGAVFLAFVDDVPDPVGHTIVRRAQDGTPDMGVFSTTRVHPDHRRAGIAGALLDAGEAWFRARHIGHARTDTATSNSPLRLLFERRGYRVIEQAPDGTMVRLSRALDASVTPPQSPPDSP